MDIPTTTISFPSIWLALMKNSYWFILSLENLMAACYYQVPQKVPSGIFHFDVRNWNAFSVYYRCRDVNRTLASVCERSFVRWKIYEHFEQLVFANGRMFNYSFVRPRTNPLQNNFSKGCVSLWELKSIRTDLVSFRSLSWSFVSDTMNSIFVSPLTFLYRCYLI